MIDAVVIGSGFGGAVSACRLAQAGLSVRVLERGRRYGRGQFPRDFRNLDGGWLWAQGRGLYDVKPLNQMTVVQAAGYGGGSLVYANVHLRPVPAVFAEGWPQGYDRKSLDPYFDLVAYMLDVRPITDSPQGLPLKTQRMQMVAEALGRQEQLCYPNLAVNFTAPGTVAANKHGVDQGGCNHCGECDIGCNVLAKNTLDLNYLALAERAGADVHTQCEAFRIEPLGGGTAGAGSAYRVLYHNHATGAPETVEARMVFLCAGAVNTTELLLRCRDEHGTLPAIGEQLGRRYSGNGDFLSFAFDTTLPFHPSQGPTITTGLVVDDGGTPDRAGSWFIIEDGGFPKELSALLQTLNPDIGPLAATTDILRAEVQHHLRRDTRTLVPSDEKPGLHAAVFLAMGRDRGNGRIALDPLGHLRVLWDVPSNLALYDTQQQVATDVARALGGKVALNPLWDRLRVPVSVHNLGGCVMADSPAGGIADPGGQLWGYPGLYVMDGAALPEATGVNPSHTIAAVAERNVERIIRRLRAQPTWSAPERARAQVVVDPLTHIRIPAGGTRSPATPTLGLTLQQSLTGYLRAGPLPAPAAGGPGPFRQAERAGKEAGTVLALQATISTTSLSRFLAAPAHAALVTGVLRADGFTSPEGAAVHNGVFNMFPEGALPGDGAPPAPRLRYALPFIGRDGRDYLLAGEAVREAPDGGLDLWGSTRIMAVIRAAAEAARGDEGPVLAAGVMRIGLGGIIEEIRSIQVTGNAPAAAKAEARLRFFKAFLGPLAAGLGRYLSPFD